MRQRTVAAFAVALCVVVATPFLAARTQQLADVRIVLLLNQAERHSVALRFDESMAHVEEAAALAEKLGDRVGLAMTYRMRALALARATRTRDAITWYLKASEAFDDLGNRLGTGQALLGLSYQYSALGDSAKARESGERALKLFEEIGDDRGRARVLHALLPFQTPAQRERQMDEIFAIAERVKDDELQGDVWRARGVGQFASGDLDRARISFETAIVAYGKVDDVDSLAATYLNLGRVFRAHGDYEGALQRYQKAIDLLAPTQERFTIIEAYNSKAVAFSYLKRGEEAVAETARGLALARESGNQRLIDFMEGNHAGNLGATGQHDQAITLLKDIIARKPEPYLAPYRFQSLATELAAVGRIQEALEPMNEAVRLTREQQLIDALPNRLDTRADILTKAGRYEDALVDSREAMALVEQVRTRLIPSDFLKRGYGERVQDGYDRIVNLLSRLGRPVEALEMAEQGRARAFLDLLATRSSSDTNLATRGPDSASTPGLASDSAGKPLRLAEMSQLARRLGSTLLTYWVGDDAVIAWIVRAEGEPVSQRLPFSRQKLTDLVAATTAPMRAPPTGATGATTRGDADLAALPMRGIGLLALSRDDKSSWRELYKALIEPLRAQLPARGGRLTIVPHGPLFHLSFAALQNAGGRYLIEDYDLHYAPSVSALEFTGRTQAVVRQATKNPWVLIGNPSALPAVGGRALAPLPGAGREMTSIASIAPKGTIRLDGAGATEAALMREIDASRPSLVHFATHGFVFDDPKVSPFLALNRKGPGEDEDGRLTLDEVYRLRLATDLVVLSACRTGSGQVSSDGIVGLTRGFFYAGSPSVMATFWDVTDDATAILMSSFYRSYASAHAKSRSLRSAQLALLADLRAGKVVITAGGRKLTLPEHPLLWAAFFLSGEP